MANVKEIKGNQITVVVVPNKKYTEGVAAVVAASTAANKMTCYVALSKPYTTLSEGFAKKRIDQDKLLFIDAVSGKVSAKGVIFVSSPKALTELSIAITNAMKKADGMVFDSLSTLLIYGDQATVIKFTHSIISRFRGTKQRCVFLALSEDASSQLMKDLGMFVDKIVYL